MEVALWSGAGRWVITGVYNNEKSTLAYRLWLSSVTSKWWACDPRHDSLQGLWLFSLKNIPLHAPSLPFPLPPLLFCNSSQLLNKMCWVSLCWILGYCLLLGWICFLRCLVLCKYLFIQAFLLLPFSDSM